MTSRDDILLSLDWTNEFNIAMLANRNAPMRLVNLHQACGFEKVS